MTKHLRCNFWIFGIGLLFASQALAGNAKNGQGNMTVTPNVVPAGSTNDFTFTFKGPNSGNYDPGSQATFLIPANWVAPQTNNSSSAGFVSVAPVLSQSIVSMGSITGSGPWTITIDFSTAQKRGGFTLSYRNVFAPTNTGVSTFTTKTKQAGGRLTSLKTGSPTITVNSPNKSNTAITLVSSLNPSIYGQTVTFTATVSSTNAAVMSGTVTFMDGDVVLGTSPINGARQATISTNGFSVEDSPHSIIAQYNGSTNFNGSISSELSQDVTEATLTVSGLVANSKTYDGNTNALLDATSATLVGVVSGDDVALDASGATGTFADKNVGTNKSVSVTGLALSGADAGNYVLSSTTATTVANITAATLTVTANDSNRVFGASNPAFAASFSGFVAGETVAVVGGLPEFSTSANSASPVGGNPYLIVVTIGTLNASNYTFVFVDGQLTIDAAVQMPATLSLVKLAGGSMMVSGTGTTNATYLVQASTNLVDWTILSTNVADVNGAFSFTESNASQFNCRFYRASKP